MAALVTALAGVGLLVLRDRTGPSDLDNGRAQVQPADLDAAASQLVEALQQALRNGGAPDLAAVAAEGRSASLRELAALASNVRRLRIDRLGLRYVGRAANQLTAAQQDLFGPHAWVADVQMTWRFSGVDRTASTVEVPLVLTEDPQEPHAAEFVSARLRLDLPADDQVPLWLAERVAVRRTARTLVLSPDRDAARRLTGQARTAVATVRRTLPRWGGPLVVEAPGTVSEFSSASGLPPSQAAVIAAVTTTTDGSAGVRSPVHVFVNPAVFGRLGPDGQQIVLSHEAAHVALDAARTRMPLWLSEGTADYIALADSSVPVRDLAAQILALVEEHGVPARLPGADEFDGSEADIGAWYEAAWLATRLIAEQHGRMKLLELYRAADRGESTAVAFRRVLGSSEGRFVREWRRHLAELAG